MSLLQADEFCGHHLSLSMGQDEASEAKPNEAARANPLEPTHGDTCNTQQHFNNSN
jgi:hypothetical protein